MPTKRNGKVRRLLKEGRAKVVICEPFTIQFLYETTEYVQEVTLGVDAGSRTVGLSATTDRKELYCCEAELRNDVKNLISTRRELRRGRRSRNNRHRARRIDNRRRPEGWLPPSTRLKLEEHLKAVRRVTEILPVSRIVVEVAPFDTQLLKNPDIEGKEYQEGPRHGFWNTREYVLYRDGHECQACHGKSKDPVLNVHHIESRKTGGNSPDNLVTLCGTCHAALHQGKIKLKLRRRSKSLRDAAFMNIVRWAVYDRLRDLHPNVSLTYGYLTKEKRVSHGIDKGHCDDAFCIAGNMEAERMETVSKGKFVRRHTRSIHVQTVSKKGVRRKAIAPHFIGCTRFQRYDKVVWNGIECFIAGSTGGRPVLRDIDWKRVTPTQSVNVKTLTFLHRKEGSILYQTVRKSP